MTIKVDPPENFLDQLREGARVVDENGVATSEFRHWLETDFRQKYDAWERIGGSDDAISETQNGELYEPGIQTSNVDELISDLETEVSIISGLVQEIEESSESEILHDLLERVSELENEIMTWPFSESDEVEVKDFFLEVAKGSIPGHSSVNQFGEAPSGLQTSATDVWSRANAATTQSVWLAPTAARIHTISSDSAADVSGGTGTTSVLVYYLPDWDTAETTETVSGDINAGVAMNNAAVMINSMVAAPQSTSTGPGSNKGTITATAAAPDSTITAVILPEGGQTEQAIYGFPSTQVAYMTRWMVGIDKASGAVASADFQIRFNPNPDVQTLAYIRQQDASVQSTGTNSFEEKFESRPKFNGPGIIKIQGIASANDVDAHSSFDLVLVEDGF